METEETLKITFKFVYNFRNLATKADLVAPMGHLEWLNKKESVTTAVLRDHLLTLSVALTERSVRTKRSDDTMPVLANRISIRAKTNRPTIVLVIFFANLISTPPPQP